MRYETCSVVMFYDAWAVADFIGILRAKCETVGVCSHLNAFAPTNNLRDPSNYSNQRRSLFVLKLLNGMLTMRGMS